MKNKPKEKGMLNGLSLFSGYAGIDIALGQYVRPIMYCEIEKYAQGILLSRMDDESIPFAPIWNDVTTLDGTKLRGLVDIIYGGFPCQDISVAGKGVGLDGKRSGLFKEIVRLCKEASPQFIFLENVPAIRTRGSVQVQEALASIGYDTRWFTLSAAEIGANHKRERWFCLASNTKRIKIRKQSRRSSREEGENSPLFRDNGGQEFMANSDCSGQCGQTDAAEKENNERVGEDHGWTMPSPFNSDWWEIEPDVGRVVDECPFRVDRIKALGNGVVPLQVKTAYEILSGKRAQR